MDSTSYLNRPALQFGRVGLTFDWVQQRINQRIAAGQAGLVYYDAIKHELNSAGIILMDGDGVTDWWISYSI